MSSARSVILHRSGWNKQPLVSDDSRHQSYCLAGKPKEATMILLETDLLGFCICSAVLIVSLPLVMAV
jgi:hypothetical protein